MEDILERFAKCMVKPSDVEQNESNKGNYFFVSHVPHHMYYSTLMSKNIDTSRILAIVDKFKWDSLKEDILHERAKEHNAKMDEKIKMLYLEGELNNVQKKYQALLIEATMLKDKMNLIGEILNPIKDQNNTQNTNKSND